MRNFGSVCRPEPLPVEDAVGVANLTVIKRLEIIEIRSVELPTCLPLNGNQSLVGVSRAIQHPSWNRNNLAAGNDIAVLLLSSSVSGVSPIRISTSLGEAVAGHRGQIVGYGNNYRNSSSAVQADAPLHQWLTSQQSHHRST